ncbi:MAG: hypothetical protein J3R72DRAFT_459590 [Linnemannia gamsii]|nr:MAG: hypothetical protein J3R72DRAFT_459590 [Linnemannia gamsii]
MRLLLSLAAVVLSITAVITPGLVAGEDVEAVCRDVNRRYIGAPAQCVNQLLKGEDYADNSWCNCRTSGVYKKLVAKQLYAAVKDGACRSGYATDYRSGKFGEMTSHAVVECIGLDSIIPHWLKIRKPSKPEGGVLVTQFLLSESGEFTAVLQSDGNIVVKRKGAVFWAITNIPRSDGPFTAVLERDGKFCVSNGKGKNVECTPSRGGSGDYKLQLGDDGHLCVRGPNPWCTGTHI